MKKIPLLSFLTFFSICAFCVADTIHVPGDQPTIQTGIDAAVNGDAVLVATGTYVVNIDFKGKGITVISEHGPALTVIDGSSPPNPDQGSCVTFMSDEGSDSVIEGFTLTGGTGNKIPQSQWVGGGGLYSCEAAPIIRGNIITQNTADHGCGIYIESRNTNFESALIESNVIDSNAGTESYRSGIFCRSVDSLIVNNSITNNDYAGITGEYSGLIVSENIISDNNGTGLNLRYSGSSIINNIIKNNHSPMDGGGIYCFTCSPLIASNLICDNIADWQGGGIMANHSSYPDIYCNVIRNNKAQIYGGGIAAYNDSSPDIFNNTIVGNEALDGGGGLYTYGNNGGWPPKFIDCFNSIYWNNTAPVGSEIYSQSCWIKIDYNNIENGLASVYESGSNLDWGSSNIDADPLFEDASQFDFHLTYDSPCRDMGDNAVALADGDFEDDPRIAYGTVDLGADEFYNHLYCTGDFSPNGSIEGKFVGMPGATPVGLFIGSGIMDPPMQHNWGEFYLEAPWLLFPLVPIPADGVLEIPATLPGTAAPYDIPMQALIGWEISNPFVVDVR